MNYCSKALLDWNVVYLFIYFLIEGFKRQDWEKVGNGAKGVKDFFDSVEIWQPKYMTNKRMHVIPHILSPQSGEIHHMLDFPI